MTVTIITRAGKGAALTHAEMDANFLALKAALEAVVTATAEGESLAEVTRSGNSLIFTGSEGTILGTVSLPSARLNARGDWTPGATYATGDIASVAGMVMGCVIAHNVSASATLADWWTDYAAGRWVVLAGLGALSPSTLTVTAGQKTVAVPSGLTFGPGMGVRLEAINLTASMDATIISYDGAGALVVDAAPRTGSGTVTGWVVRFSGGGGGAGSGWDRVEYPTLPYTATTADAGALLFASSGTLTLPGPGTVPPGTALCLTGFDLSVASDGKSWTVDGGEVAVFTTAAGAWAVTRHRTADVGDYVNDHVPDLAFVFAPPGDVVDRQYYGPGWSPSYGQQVVTLVSAAGEVDAHAAWVWISGPGVMTYALGVLDLSDGYRVAGDALALRHLADVDPALTPTAGQVLAWDDGAGAFRAVTPAQTTDGAAGIARVPTYAVAGLPAAADHARGLVHVSDGDAGAPCLALSDGTDWRRVPLGAAVSAT